MNYPYQLQTFQDYQEAYKHSVEDPSAFWANIAENFTWKRKWDTVLDWNFKEPQISWFKGAQLNITENCLDRHLATRGNEPAIIWESNNPDEHHRVLTYNELHFKVQQFANVLLNNGVRKGDRVCIYMGMIPELAIATLACARIGAVHSVIFGKHSMPAPTLKVIPTQVFYDYLESINKLGAQNKIPRVMNKKQAEQWNLFLKTNGFL